MSIHKRLGRRFKIGLSANGYVFVRDSMKPTLRETNEFATNALPAYSTDTREEATSIIVRKCSRGYDGRYIWPEFSGTLGALTDVGEEMERIHMAQQASAIPSQEG
jgi:hypothetical protein